MNRILASIKKDAKVMATTWRSHGLSVLIVTALMIYIMHVFEGRAIDLNYEKFLLIRPLIENSLLFMPFLFAFTIIQPVNQELLYKERIKRNFESLLTTPLKKEELWFAKTITITTFGFIYYLVSLSVIVFVIKLYFPNVWYVVTLLGYISIANTVVLTFLTMLLMSSITGWLFLIMKNCQNVNKAPLMINFAFVFGYGYLSRVMPIIPMMLMDIVMLVMTIIVIIVLRKILIETALEKIIIND